MAEAELQILNSVNGKIEDYLEVQFHVGTASVLGASGDAGKHPDDRRAKTICPASPGLAVGAGARRTICGPGQCRRPGGSGLTTIGGGQILGLSNTRLRRKKQWTLDLLAARREAVPIRCAGANRWCAKASRPPPSPASRRNAGAAPEEMTALLETLRAEGRVRSRRPAARGCTAMSSQKTATEHSRRRPDFSRRQSATGRYQPRRTACQRSRAIRVLLDAAADRCWKPSNSNATAPCWRGPAGTRGLPIATSACATRLPRNCSRPAGRRRRGGTGRRAERTAAARRRDGATAGRTRHHGARWTTAFGCIATPWKPANKPP